MESLLLKLYYVYSIQRQSIGNMAKLLLESGQQPLLEKNSIHVRSLMSQEQLLYFNRWMEELQHPEMIALMNDLEGRHGVTQSLTDSTHLTEVVPETKTELIEDS